MRGKTGRKEAQEAQKGGGVFQPEGLRFISPGQRPISANLTAWQPGSISVLYGQFQTGRRP